MNPFEIASKTATIISTLKGLLPGIKAETRDFFLLGLENYLNSQAEKYETTNTFIHRDQKVRFEDIYVPLTIRRRDKEKIRIDSANDLFTQNRFIGITGTAGSGKSTVMKCIFLSSLSVCRKIPVLIELRHLNDYAASLEDFISEKVLKLRLKHSPTTLQRAFKSGEFIFLFDGYDELTKSSKKRVTYEIETFTDAYNKNCYIISSRPGAGCEQLPRFQIYELQPLNKTDIQLFVSKIMKNEEERKEKILRTIDGNTNYKDYLRNPLLLSMFILAFQSYPEIPHRKTAFYRNVFDTLYAKHDGVSKNSFQRERLTNLQFDDFQKVISYFSYISLYQGKYVFDEGYLSDTLQMAKKALNHSVNIQDLIYDLSVSIAILIQDGLFFSFPHKSMQEYFTAIFFKHLPEDRKKAFYSKFIDADPVDRFSVSVSNLWDLLDEVDRPAMIEYIYRPALTTILGDLKGKKGESLISSFNKYISVLIEAQPITVYDEHGHSKQQIDIGIYWGPRDFNSTVVEYLNLIGSEISEFPQISGSTELFADFMDDRNWEYRQETMHELIPILASRGFDVVVEDFVKSIEAKLHQYDHELLQAKSSLDDLLLVSDINFSRQYFDEITNGAG